MTDLNKTVKHDIPVKMAVLCTAISAYIPDCQLNTFLRGGSSHGKTYNVTEVTKYFPEADVWSLGGLSPKALVHDHGVRLNSCGKEIDLMDKPKKPRKGDKNEREYEKELVTYREKLKAWNKEVTNSYILIDLNNTIMEFLESPNEETLNVLKPILSHDKNKIEFKFADKNAGGGHKTTRVIIKGHPATLFCSTDKKYVEEQATRGLTVTPEATPEKYEKANEVTMNKHAYKWKHKKQSPEQLKIKQMIWEIRDAFVTNNYDVAIPFPNMNKLYPHTMARDMRDFKYFNKALTAIGVLNMHRRVIMEIDGCCYVLPSISDVKKVCSFFREIFETTRTGTDAEILEFYWKYVAGWFGGATVRELTEAFNCVPENIKNKKSTDTIRSWLKRLRELNYVESYRSEDDKRTYEYLPLMTEREMLFENSGNSGESDNQLDLTAFLKKGFESWLENIGGKVRWLTCKKSTENTVKLMEITEEEASDIICK